MDPLQRLSDLDVGQVAAVATKVSGPQLEAALGAAVWLGELPEEENAWTYRTRPGNTKMPAEVTAQALVREGLMPNLRVWPLRKKHNSVSFQGVLLVGRATSNDVVISHASVSKLHARVNVGPGLLTVEDAGSSNGTWLNDRRLDATPVAMGHGDRVRVGDVIIRVTDPPTFVRQVLAAISN